MARAMRFLSFFARAAVVGALSWPVAARAGDPPINGPYMTGLSDTGVTVRFELERPAAATVEVVREADAEAKPQPTIPRSVFESRVVSNLHVVGVSGLEPATRYSYVVRAEHVAVAEGRFTTGPRPVSGTTMTFLVYGDDRTDDDAHAAVVRAMMQVPSLFLVQTGDMVADGGSAKDWQRFFDIERPLLRERPLFAAIGNHELFDDAAGGNFARYLGFSDAAGATRPYGTVRVGNARFFFLNGMHGWDSGEERHWLERELGRADGESGLVWRFAVVHQGPWSAGPHGPNVQLVEARVPELLASHKVDLLFAGHDHLYERGDAGLLKYLISGGGGAPLYRDWHPTATTRKVEAAHHFIEVSTTADAVRIVARRSDGSVLDRCGFLQGGPWDCDSHDRARPAGDASAAAGGDESSVPPAGPKAPDRNAQASEMRCLCNAPGSVAGRRGVSVAAIVTLIGLAGLFVRRVDPGSRGGHG